MEEEEEEEEDWTDWRWRVGEGRERIGSDLFVTRSIRLVGDDLSRDLGHDRREPWMIRIHHSLVVLYCDEDEVYLFHSRTVLERCVRAIRIDWDGRSRRNEGRVDGGGGGGRRRIGVSGDGCWRRAWRIGLHVRIRPVPF